MGHMDSEVIWLLSRACALAAKFEQGGEISYLNEAIVLDRESSRLCPPGHLMRSFSLTCLSTHLSNRYKRLGAMMDLEEAIVLGRNALELCPTGISDRSTSLNNLAGFLSTRYDQLGRTEDLSEAINLGRDSLVLCPLGHPGRSISLNNFAQLLYSRHNLLGRTEDLNEAIVYGRDALMLCAPGHACRSMSLDNLGVYLSARYDQLGAVEDLVEAIVLGRDALALCPPQHPDRSRYLNNLAARLYTLYNQVGEMDNLNDAIVLCREALALCSPGHPSRSASVSNLGAYLSVLYDQLGEIKDINEAIVLGRQALELFPLGHPNRAIALGNLADYLSYRYKRLAAIEDLNEAISLARDALVLCPPGHPDRSRSLDGLASYLRMRFTRLNQLKDKEELFNLYIQISHMPPTSSSADLFVARSWITAAEDFRHPTTLLAYETCLQLLVHHLAALPPLPQHLYVFKSATSSIAMDTFSACLRNGSPTKAVELLEQGRGVFFSQLTRLRSPLNDVISSGPAGKTLAGKFTELASLIRNVLDSPGADQHDRVCRLNVDLQKVVAGIRTLPGLSHFLLPSPFPDLQKAASGGPVIIVNASTFSCDALIVLPDRAPIHIPLQITRACVRELSSEFHTWVKRAKLMSVTKYFVAILRELWDKVVSPIVHFLQTIHPPQSRIWWCPTAEFSLLPLHAAGSYRKGQQKLSDIYISSYASTLSALIRARRDQPTSSPCKGLHFAAIGQAKPAGERELHFVGAELVNIGQRIKSLATFKNIEGSDSCISRVVEELDKNEWVHLACHGLPNQKQPFMSAFALCDGHLTIERIIQCDLQNARFAYLSACHTTVGDEECPDEMIHLASAMQFAGFRSVIGTMWAVDDEQTKKITSMFYDNMVDESGHLDHTRAAFALHKTVQTLEDVSFDQRILYIHLGA